MCCVVWWWVTPSRQGWMMISEWRWHSKSAGLWQYQTFRHGLIYWTASSAMQEKYFLLGPHAVCPFGIADWLNRLRAFIIYTVFLIKKKKCKKSSVASAASSIALHGLPKQITAGRGSNTEPGIAKPVALFHHSHRIVDSSRQSSPNISPKDCFKCSKFWGVDNYSYKLIIQLRGLCQREAICPSRHLISGG